MEKVTIKSYPNGLSLYIDHDGIFEDILLEIGQKFQKSASFFKDATLVLSIDGRDFSIKEEREVIRVIESNSNISICAIAGKDPDKEMVFENKLQNLKSMMKYTRVEVKEEEIIKGSILKGDSIESNMTVIVLGDVEVGASVSSEKNIIVLGTIYGEAFAGVGDGTEHFIFASSMDPELIRIGDRELIIDKKVRKQIKKESHIALIQTEEIIVKPIKKGIFEDK